MPAPYATDEAASLQSFASAVRLERKKRGVSQEKLAALAGINRGYMGNIERGGQNPTLLLMLRIAAALELSLVQLISTADL